MKAKHQERLIAMALAALAFTANIANAAVLVTNPSFEDNNPGGVGYGSISGWTNAGASGVNNQSQPFLNQAAHSGDQVAFIQGSGTISQSLSGFDPTKNYSVTYFVSERGQVGASTSTSVSLDGGGSSFSYPGSIVPTDRFRRVVSGPLAVSGANSTLQISGTQLTGDASLLIDSVSVTRAVPAVPDGGFETPVQPNTNTSTRYKLANGEGDGTLVGASWNFQGRAGIGRNGSAFGAATTPEGSQYAILSNIDQNSLFSTTVNGFESGVTYSLSFEALGRTGGVGPNEIQVLLDGNPLEFAGATSITPGQASWSTFTTDDFITSGGSSDLTFMGLSSGDRTSFIDDVRFNFVAEAIPEPSVALLSGLGMLSLLLRRRRH